MERRSFIQITAGSLGLLGLEGQSLPLLDTTIESKKMFELGVVQAQELMAKGELSSYSLCRYYLARLDVLDRSGPGLNSILEINPDALTLAETMDRHRKEHGPLSPLHGIPVLIKGNIGTMDRMDTSAGSLALAGFKAPEDATIIDRLRKAGAVILGKTNLSEWANFRSTRSSSGWSSQGGQTRNPYSIDRSPCGSSSGSGVAVASDLCLLAIGTETDGSIVCPSGINGIVGIKPTLGLVSRSGIIPLAHSQDTAGPMARTVSDAAVLLNFMTGEDPKDAITMGKEHGLDYRKFLITDKLHGVRIGVARQFAGFHEGVDAVFEQALESLKGAGAVLVDPVTFSNLESLDKDEFTVLLYEFKHDLDQYLKQNKAPEHVNSMEKLIEFNKKNAPKVMPWFKQEIFEMASKKGGLDEKEYLDALANSKKNSGAEGVDQILTEHNLDAIVAPTNGPAWKIDLINGDHFMGGSSSLAAISGYPSITVPAGYVSGLPIGISFFGKAFSEGRLIEIAYGFEQKTRHRVPPKFLSSVET